MKTRTNFDLVNYAVAQIGRPYWFGTFGQIASKALLDEKSRQYPKYYTAKDFEKQFGQKVHDCAGLVKGCIMSTGPDAGAKYMSKYDLSADAIIRRCSTTGEIDTLPNMPGVVLWKPGHLGVYLGEFGANRAVEAKGHKWGVTYTNDTSWQKWGVLDAWFDYLTLDDFITNLYKSLLCRDPMPEGFRYWRQELKKRALDVNETVIAFLNSPEFLEKDLTPAEFVRRMYRALFSREPDAPGEDFWIRNMKSYGRDFVIYGMLAAHEFQQKANYYNSIR